MSPAHDGSDGVAYTAPGLSGETGTRVASMLQERLNTLNGLALILKHVHWNVVGPHFIGVHTMLDPQVEAVRAMVDETAERIATLGGSPSGTPSTLASAFSWDDYAIGRADAITHLTALDVVYTGVITRHRAVIGELEELDLVTQDLLIDHVEQLELFQWFVRAHLENAGGELTDGHEPAADQRGIADH
ncbi:MAG: DNA starvation/stationary phase protection protein [Actinomycetales bacterium]|nr:DNA starvation/stationary phase protection protein [Actinomycetales bacterium]